MGISIAIATYNRAGELELTLASLARGDRRGFEDFEVLVIDNNSTDHTAQVATKLAPLFGGRLRHILEEKQGLSHARNRAISEARYDIVAFLDDDVNVDLNWMRQLAVAYQDEEVAAVGGRASLNYPSTKPKWLGEGEEALLTKVELGSGRRPALPDEIFGVNLSFRKEWFERVGGFRTDLGRVGTCLLGSEEGELLERIAAAGGCLFYEPAVFVEHRVAPERLRRRWFWSRQYWGARGESRRLPEQEVSPYQMVRRTWHVALACMGLLRSVLIHHPLRETCFQSSVVLAGHLGFCTGMALRLTAKYGIRVANSVRVASHDFG